MAIRESPEQGFEPIAVWCESASLGPFSPQHDRAAAWRRSQRMSRSRTLPEGIRKPLQLALEMLAQHLMDQVAHRSQLAAEPAGGGPEAMNPLDLAAPRSGSAALTRNMPRSKALRISFAAGCPGFTRGG